MDKKSYDVRASIMVRYIVLQSKKDGYLQRLKKEYEQIRRGQVDIEFNEKSKIFEKEGFPQNIYGDGGLMSQFDEEICPLAKRRRIQNVKERLRAALRLNWGEPEEIDEHD